MRRLLCIFWIGLFLWLVEKSGAQNIQQKIESLQIQIKRSTSADFIQIIQNLSKILNEIDFEIAKREALRTIQIAKGLPHFAQAIPESYRMLGQIYLSNNRTHLATQMFLESAKMYQANGQILQEAICYFGIGMFQYQQQNYDISSKYFFKTLDVGKDSLDDRTTINCYNGLALIAQKKEKFQEADDFFQKAIQIAKQKNDTAWIGIVSGNLGKIAFLKRNYALARKYYEADVEMSRKTDELESVARAYVSLAELSMAEVKFQKAQVYLDSAYQVFQKRKNLSILKEIYEGYIALHRLQKDFEKAFYYQNQWIAINDSLNTIQKSNELKRIQYQYDFKQQQSEIDLLNKMNQSYENTIQGQNLLTWITILWIGLLLITAFVLYRNNLNKQRTNAILNEKNQKINQQKAQIEEQKQILEETYEKLLELDSFKRGMTEMIVKDIKNPLYTILGLAQIKEVKEAATQMFDMTQNLLNVQKLENTDFQLNVQDYFLYKIVNEAYNQVRFMTEKKSLHIDSLVSQHTKVKVDFEIIVRVFVNLFTNAIKNTPNNGRIVIKARVINQWVDVIFKDTGTGISEENQQMIFTKFNQIFLRNEGSVRTTGLGLAFCKMAVEAHGGEIGVESELNIGTAFWFTLPLGEQTRIIEKSVQATLSHSTENHQADKAILKPYLQKLQKFTVFEYSDIKAILEQIHFPESTYIQEWKASMENVVKACNEEKYQELIQDVGEEQKT